MAILTKTAITSILQGDSVDPTIANVPHNNLETNIDDLISYIKNRPTGWFEYNDITSTGLTFEFDGGVYNNQNVPTDIAAGNRSLSASATNYIEINTNTALVTHNSTTFNRENIPLWEVTTNGSSITGVIDRRSPYNLRSTRGIEDTATTQWLFIDNTNSTFNNNVMFSSTSTITGIMTHNARPAFNGGTSGSSSPFTVDSTQVVTNLNADLLDGVSGGSFVRSDTADSISGVLSFSARPAFNGGITGTSSPFTVDSTFKVTNLNADLLDGISQESFLRSDAADIKTSGNLTFNDNVYLRIGTGADVEHWWNGTNYYTDINGGANWYIRDGNSGNATRFTFDVDTGVLNATGGFTHNGNTVWSSTNDGTASGLDADLLDGQHGSYYTSYVDTQDFKFPYDMTGSRSLYTNYTNNTGATLFLSVAMQNLNNYRGELQCLISRSGYTSVTVHLMSWAGNADMKIGGFWVVPEGATYRVMIHDSSTRTIERWIEYSI